MLVRVLSLRLKYISRKNMSIANFLYLIETCAVRKNFKKKRQKFVWDRALDREKVSPSFIA